MNKNHKSEELVFQSHTEEARRRRPMIPLLLKFYSFRRTRTYYLGTFWTNDWDPTVDFIIESVKDLNFQTTHSAGNTT